MDRKRLVLAVVALAAGLAIAGLMLTNEVRPPDATDSFVVVGVAWSFVASGLVAWQLRPGNAIGPVMVGTGFLQLGTGLAWSQNPVLFLISHLLHLAVFASVTFVLLAFPNGQLGTTLNRGIFTAAVLVVLPLNLAWLVFGGQPWHGMACSGCPEPLLLVTDDADVRSLILWTQEAVGLLVAISATAILLRRWRRASAHLRFAIAPVLWIGAVALVVLLLYLLYLLSFPASSPLGQAPWVAVNAVVAAVPIAFLIGVARTRLARTVVADLVVEMRGADEPLVLRDSLARALHDPSVAVAYWLEDAGRYVDTVGRAVDLPGPGEARAVTLIEREGRRVAALTHDPALGDNQQLVESVCAAAALQIDNERLQAELRARIDEVEASRTRIVEAAMSERRRIERDLHDGTQQRLVAVGMSLGLAEAKVAAEPQGALTLVREARGRLAEALEELRALSQGIHPGILTERGLPAALDEMRERVDLPVELNVSIAGRLPEQVEEALYYVVSEGLNNALKHAHASRATVHVDRVDDVALARVSDDGSGGADERRGTGLRGLRDRVEALGGQLSVASPLFEGTVLEAQIPCAS